MYFSLNQIVTILWRLFVVISTLWYSRIARFISFVMTRRIANSKRNFLKKRKNETKYRNQRKIWTFSCISKWHFCLFFSIFVDIRLRYHIFYKNSSQKILEISKNIFMIRTFLFIRQKKTRFRNNDFYVANIFTYNIVIAKSNCIRISINIIRKITSLLVNFFKKISCRTSELELNRILTDTILTTK